MEKATASGRPAEEPFDNPTPTNAKKPDGQYVDHWVLSPEERAKGFIRPVRRSYIHVGPPKPSNLRDLTEEEKKLHEQWGYIKYEAYSEDKAPVVGKYWTQAELDKIDGCGVVTTMGETIAQTYARDPRFYGSTFCCGCNNYLRVGEYGEFVWDDAARERVGT